MGQKDISYKNKNSNNTDTNNNINNNINNNLNNLQSTTEVSTNNLELLNPKQDYVFKRIFGHKGNEDVTKEFLSAILNQNITKIDLDNSTILDKDILTDKVGILDIRAVIDDGTNCDIEMQVVDRKDIEKRILFYWSKMYISGITQGYDYDQLKKTVIILILDYKLEKLSKIEHFITNWQIREKDYPKTVLTDVLDLYILELPKFNSSKLDNNKKLLNSWINFIENPKEVNIMPNSKIQKAKDVLEEISQDEHERYLADLRLKYIMDQKAIEGAGYDKGLKAGQKSGYDSGVKIGIRQNQIEIIKNMLNEHIDLATISRITKVRYEGGVSNF